MADELTYWLPPSAVKQSGKTISAAPIFRSWIKRATRSGTLSENGFQLACARPEPVNPTRSQRTGNRFPRPRPACWSYSDGSQTPSLRTWGSPRRLPFSILEVCSSTTSLPPGPLARLSAMRILVTFGSAHCSAVPGDFPPGKVASKLGQRNAIAAGRVTPDLACQKPQVRWRQRRFAYWRCHDQKRRALSATCVEPFPLLRDTRDARHRRQADDGGVSRSVRFHPQRRVVSRRRSCRRHFSRPDERGFLGDSRLSRRASMVRA